MFTTFHVPLMRNSAKNVKQLIIRSFYSCLKSYTMHHIEAHLMSTIDCVNYATFLPIAISQKGFSDILRLLRSTPVLSAKTPIFTAKSTTLFTPTHNFIIVSRSNCQVLLCYRALCVSFLC